MKKSSLIVAGIVLAAIALAVVMVAGINNRAISLEELGEELKKIKKRKIVVGDGAKLCYNALREQDSQMELAPEPLRMQSAQGVARAALEQIRAGRLVKGRELVPVYHRLSQAERERLERERQSRDNQNK